MSLRKKVKKLLKFPLDILLNPCINLVSGAGLLMMFKGILYNLPSTGFLGGIIVMVGAIF